MKTHYTKEFLLRELNRKLKYHPGDAPWSCVACYHGKPCVEQDILRLAKSALEKG